MVEKINFQEIQDVATLLKLDAIKATDTCNSGHCTSCMSIAEVFAVLMFSKAGMKFDPKNIKNKANDVLVVSKGHCAPIYYAAFIRSGMYPYEDLLTLRKFTSDFEGHPTPKLSFVDFATGSLGMGLANSVGVAYSSKYLDNNPNRVFCIVGDAELMEGSNWEAAHFASFYKLDNLVVILDLNKLGQSDFTSLQHDVKTFEGRFREFGFRTICIDGHNVEEVYKAFEDSKEQTGKPTVIIAKTEKGHGHPKTSLVLGLHGKALQMKDVYEDIEKTLVNKNPEFKTYLPEHTFEYKHKSYERKFTYNMKFDRSKKYSNREAFGLGLVEVGKQDEENLVVCLDGDVKNSTFLEYYYKAFPHKFINCYVAEQLMASIAVALDKRNKIPLMSTFCAFFSRCFDQIRVNAISGGNVKYYSSHCGCHIGEDGASQMGLEDIAMFRTVPGMIVLCPSDPISTANCAVLAMNVNSSVYIRTSRNAIDYIYNDDHKFEIGKLNVIRNSDSDVLSLISHGMTIPECLSAQKVLASEGINVRVIDLFSVKPIDKEGLIKNISETNKLAIVVEDHYFEGGAAEAVRSAVCEEGFVVVSYGVKNVPRSGKPSELYDMYELSSKYIVDHVKKALNKLKK